LLYIYAIKYLVMHDKKILFTILLLTVVAMSGIAQQSILSTSNDASGTGGMVSYSVGQVAYIINSGIVGTITEGVQQPFEIQIPEGIEQEQGITLECILYPNPANAFIRLKTNNSETRLLSYQLRNLEGLLLQNNKIEHVETTIPMDDLAPATYFLTISEQDKSVKTFKIIKK